MGVVFSHLKSDEGVFFNGFDLLGQSQAQNAFYDFDIQVICFLSVEKYVIVLLEREETKFCATSFKLCNMVTPSEFKLCNVVISTELGSIVIPV